MQIQSDKARERVRIGVAGAGKMGSNHIRVLSELNGSFDLVGVYDPLPERAKIAESCGATAYSSFEEMLEHVDAVTLPCPTSLHKKMAMVAAEHGVHALVEKPVCEWAADAAELCAMFSGKGLTLTVGHVERFNPVVQAIADIAKKMNVVSIEVHRCSPFDGRIFDADVVQDLMIHDIDLVVNAIAGETPEQTYAIGRNVYSSGKADYAHAELVFPSGKLASLTASRCTEDKIRTIAVHCAGAYIFGDLVRQTLTIQRSVKYDEWVSHPNIDYKQSGIIEQIAVPIYEPLRAEMLDFRNAILGISSPRISFQQIVRTMDVLDRIETEIYRRGV